MTLTSYAQNFEDVMLMRAFAEVEHGTYIDVGAQDPTIDSVSLAFHQRGWSGVHVEPSSGYAAMLRQQRPSDLVIEAAIGEVASIVTFYETVGGGISTTIPEIAASHRARGIPMIERQMPVLPLSAVLERCAGKTVQWLKLDIEGSERSALASWGPTPLRPLVVVVEATLPLTSIPSFHDWEPLLLAKGYAFVYFDGLNRYYVSNAAPELKRHFAAPPNVFDDFELNGTSTAPFHRALERRINDQAAQLIAGVQQHQGQLESAAQAADERLQVLEQRRAQEVEGAHAEIRARDARLAEGVAQVANLNGLLAAAAEREAQLQAQVDAARLEAQTQAAAFMTQLREHTTGPMRVLQDEVSVLQARLRATEAASREQGQLWQERLNAALVSAREDAAHWRADLARVTSHQEAELASAQDAARAQAKAAQEHHDSVLQQARERALTLEAEGQALRAALDTQTRAHEAALAQLSDERASEAAAARGVLEECRRGWAERERALVEDGAAARATMVLAEAESERLRAALAAGAASLAAAQAAAVGEAAAARGVLEEGRREWAERERALVEDGAAARAMTAQAEAESEHLRAALAAGAASLAATQAAAEEMRQGQARLEQALRDEAARAAQAEAASAQADAERAREADEARREQLRLEEALKQERGRASEQLHGAQSAARDDLARIRRLMEQLEDTRVEASRQLAQAEDRIRFLRATLAASPVGPGANFASAAASAAPAAALRPATTAPAVSRDEQPPPPLTQKRADHGAGVPAGSNVSAAISPGETAVQQPIQHLNQLLALRASDFVTNAYRAVLGRDPDPDGGSYFLQRLATEQDRAQILFELGTSDEAVRYGPTLPGLQALIDSKRPGRRSFRRWLQRVLKIDHGIARLEASVGFAADESAAKLGRIESTLARLSCDLEEARQRAQAQAQSLLAVESKVTSILVVQRSMAGLQEEMARQISSLPASAAPHAGRVAAAAGDAPSALDCAIDGSRGPATLVEDLAEQLRATSQAKSLSYR